MRILHTADWHVGKVLKGRSRHDEHAAVLAELAALADAEDVDVVVVAGDLFDTSAPPPAAQELVMRTLLALRGAGREVIVLAGNHDNPALLEVYRPVLGALGMHVIGAYHGADDGGAFTINTPAGERLRVAALPFLAHRHAVRALEALTRSPDQHTAAYGAMVAMLLEPLTAGFTTSQLNLLVGHATLPAALLGGGERQAQTVVQYHVPVEIFPANASYVALGHLHRRQRVGGPCPIWYSGAPLAVDFGDEGLTPGALLVDLDMGRPAWVREHVFTSPRRLRTVRGDLAALAALAPEVGEAWLRVVVAEPRRPGLADEVRQILPGAIEIDLDPQMRPVRDSSRTAAPRPHAPRDLLRAYLAATGRAEEDLLALFDRLHDDVVTEG